LGRGFFVSAGSIGLPGNKQTGNPFGLQTRIELRRVHIVVFYRIAGPHHDRSFQSRNTVDKLFLHLLWQAGGDPVKIHFFGLQTFGLNENLMPGSVRKLNDLIFNTGAIAGT
jgi:hypothetical protein